ncbi:hypothetical protein HHK36_008137 [Tetracentron sinense]|uniref:Uncharacterized protein n=1 Tax=Tetracentron sinense TaxID=13715 RepID=A0A834ZPJ8_TETSI|nr:hypothetical protein HHK36_008137 [Tetracentron sinense]
MSVTTASIYYYHLGNHGGSRRRFHAPVFSPYCLPGSSTTKHGYRISANQRTHQFNINHRVISKRALNMKINVSNNSQPEAPPPAKSPSSAWKKWILGLILPMFLPFLRYKGGLLLTLKNKVDMAVETVETVTEVVENLAEQVEKVADEVGDKLPDDAKLKKTIGLVEDLAKEAVEKADQAQEIIHKVREVEKALLESNMDLGKADQSKSPEDLDALVRKSDQL